MATDNQAELEQRQEELLNEMLSLADATIDKRPGSILYDLAFLYALKQAELEVGLIPETKSQTFIGSCTGEDLDSRANDYGLYRLTGTQSQRVATFTGITPSIGTQFQAGNFFWTLISTNLIQCESIGIKPNEVITGTTLIPTSVIIGLESATMGAVLVLGDEPETDDELRERLINFITTPERNANQNQIRKWCMEVSGVGDALVQPVWDGINTVKAYLVNTQFNPANTALVNQVQEYIDPGSAGLGEGVAPIGCKFTAVAANAINVTFSVKAQLTFGATTETVRVKYTELINQYFATNGLFSLTVLSLNKMGALLLTIPEVQDYDELTLNGLEANLSIPYATVPQLAGVTINVL
jgi:uncharacterized phage protein gp47/JayE